MRKVEQRLVDNDIMYPFTYSGVLSVVPTDYRLYNDSGSNRLIKFVRASVGTAAIGDYIMVDLLKDGQTIFYNPSTDSLGAHLTSPNHRPYIPAAQFTGIGTPLNPIWETGTYLTVSITHVGSTLPGSDMTLSVVAE